MTKLFPTVLFLLMLSSLSTPLHAQSGPTLPERIQSVMMRPEFAHTSFGIEFYSLDRGQVIYQLNPNKLMVPGSTTKLFTEGTVLELLGGDYRFHTRVYRTGPVKKDGTLDGESCWSQAATRISPAASSRMAHWLTSTWITPTAVPIARARRSAGCHSRNRAADR